MSALKELGVSLRIPADKQDDPEIRRELAQLDALLTANPLLAYNNAELNPAKVHKQQLDFHAIKPPPMGIKALIAGNRSGKTVCCIVDDIIQAIDADEVPEHLSEFKKWEGPITIWIGAPKYAKHEDTILPMLRKFIPKSQLLEGSFDKSYKAQARKLTLSNGSEFFFKTYDQDRDAWASAEVHRIHWDEEPNILDSKGLRDEARARLISTGGEEIIGMTPLLGYSWVNDEVWERREEDNVSVVQMSMADNPWASREAIKEYEAGLTEEEKRARLHGEFVHFGGMFFDEFREGLHVTDPITPEHLKGQEVVVGIDPGWEKFAVTWTAFDKENAALVFDEFNPGTTVVPDVAKAIKEKNKAWGIKEPTYVIDPSARNTTTINADQVEAAFAREEIYCQHAQNSRQAGILEMKRRLQTKKGDTPDPTLKFTRDCPETRRQVEKYRRDPKSQDEWKAMPQTKAIRFDLVDTVRYSVMSRTWEFPEDAPERQSAFQPNWQPPYSTEHFPQPSPPMGAFT